MDMGMLMLERCSGMAEQGRLGRTISVVIIPVPFPSEPTTKSGRGSSSASDQENGNADSPT